MGGPPFNCTISPPGTAKNSLTIAAHNSGSGWQNTEGYSSYGPTRDANWDATSGYGRLKPDISSDGQISAAWGDGNRDGNQDSNYQSMSGTSPSSAAATGGGALVTQYYKDGYYPVTPSSPNIANGFTPSAALVKASMINGARDAPSGSQSNEHDYNLNGHLMDYPNNDQGWGMTDLGDSLYFYGESREMIVDDNQVGLLTDKYREYKFKVDSGIEDLEITTVWTDYKGSIATCGALVNDLELTVTDPIGTVYYGNNYGSSSRESDSTNPAGRDHVNNVECALIKNPMVGEWTINVSASNIPVGPQPYALVLTGDFDEDFGWVKFDKHVYKNNDTVQIQVEDLNVATGSIDINLVSSTGDTETVTLNEVGPNARRFTGTIITTLGDPAVDGLISIENGGWISAQYTDSTPFHISYANASTDVTKPMISNVYVTDISHNVAIVHWTTDVPATSQVFYGETASLGSSTPFDPDMTLSHAVTITGLTEFTDYYFDVESTSIGGVTTRDSNGGTHYMFTTVDNPDILIVLEHSDVESSERDIEHWKTMLDNYNWTYSGWETVKYGLPSVSDLNSAKAIIWETGESYPQLGSDERAVIQSWVNQGGQQLWFTSGQDIGWDMCDAAGTDVDNTWYAEYLHATFERDDANGGGGIPVPPIQILGTTHEISNGLGPYDLGSPWGGSRYWPDDISNNQGGDVPPPWDYSMHAGGGDAAAIAYAEANFKVVYEAFTHIGVVGIDNQSIMLDRALIWLFGGDHPDVEVLSPNGGEMVSGTSVPISWNIANAVTLDVQISRDGGQSYVVEASGLPGATTSYSWDTTTSGTYGPGIDFPNGDYYRVKIMAYGTNLKAFDVSDANFTVFNGPGGDDLGPVIWAGSVKPSPIPVERWNLLHITAIADDRFKGNSYIQRVEYYIDGTSPADLIGPMDPTDGVFDASLESAEIDYLVLDNVGAHTLYVRAQDTFSNWGDFESIVFYVDSGIPPVPWVDLLSPDGGEVLMGGDSHSITWNMEESDISNHIVDIYYSTDSGATYPNTIALGLTGFTANPCSFNWDPIPMIDSDTVRVRVVATNFMMLSDQDESQGDFEIDSTPPVPAFNVHAELEGTSVVVYWNASSSPDVDHYEVHNIMNGWDASGDTYSLLADTGLDLSYGHTNVGINNPNSYFYQIRTYDLAGHETRTTLQAAKTGSTQSLFANPTGWFLLGSALVQSDTSLAHVLQGQGMPGNYDLVQMFDAQDQFDPWKSYSDFRPASLNDLTDINYAQGFWLHMTMNGRYATAGYITNLALPMATGWNLVPYPFAVRQNTTAEIEAHLQANCPNYDSMLIADHTQPYRLKVPTGTENLLHGMGLWVKVTADTSWTVMNY